MESLMCSVLRHTETGGGAESDGGFPINGFDPDTAAGVLAGFDPSGLGEGSLLTVVAGMERLVAAAHAAQVKALGGLAGLRPATVGHPFGEFVADEVAVELSMTRRAAENRVGQAVEMTTRTPTVLRALEAGVLDLYRAKVITDATHGLDEQVAKRVATHVVERAEGRNSSEVRALVRRAVLDLDPEGAQRRHETARAGRAVVLAPLEDGMAELIASLPAEQATAVYRKVYALARGSRIPGDERSADARRADVFVNLLLGRRDPGTADEPDRELRPLVHVTVSATTLAGADDKPAVLDGYGPIGAAYARKIAADPTGVWKRLVTNPIDGSLLEHSRNTRGTPTGHRPHSMTSFAPGTENAGFLGASTPRKMRIWITPSRGRKDPPRPETSARCAVPTTA